MDSVAVGMCLAGIEGHFIEVNSALCEFLGYDADRLLRMTWQEITAPDYLRADLDNRAEILAGQIESYRAVMQYIHADGHLVWGDLSLSGVCNEDGGVEYLVALINDITAQKRAEERNRIAAQQLRCQNELLKAELRRAAEYMSSIMPHGLHGAVAVSSRYLPSRELGGDCFDYTWIDGDHLIVYLIDVSGHGLEPALLAASLQNMLRSGTFDTETLLDPEGVLAEFNRLFQMEQQSDHFFTMWYGVYEKSTRTLQYASAGAPPAYAFNAAPPGSLTTTELSTDSAPVGVFEDTEFTTGSYCVPHGCRILVFSDGASEQILADGTQLSQKAFKRLTTRLAASPDWSLDDLVSALRSLTASGFFHDDCSLVQMAFD